MARRTQKMRVEPPTPWARYLVARREARNKAQIELFREVAADLEWGPDSTALYGDMERGTRPPTAKERAYFLKRYGDAEVPAEFDDPEPVSADDPLVTALRDQTRAIDALVGRLDLLVSANSTASIELMRAIGVVAAGLGLRGTHDASDSGVQAGNS